MVEWGGEGGEETEVDIPEGSCLLGLGVGFGGHVHNVICHVGKMPSQFCFKSKAPYYQELSQFAVESEFFGGKEGDKTKTDMDKQDFSSKASRIKKIKVYYVEDEYVYGFKIKYEIKGEKKKGRKYKGKDWKDAKDDKDGKKGKIKLKSGVNVVRVFGRCGDWMDKLGFELSNGDVYEFGGEGGHAFEIDIPEGHVVGAFKGSKGDKLN